MLSATVFSRPVARDSIFSYYLRILRFILKLKELKNVKIGIKQMGNHLVVEQIKQILGQHKIFFY